VEEQQAHEVSDDDARAEGTAGLADLQARWDSNPRWPRWASDPRLRVIRFETINLAHGGTPSCGHGYAG
jgi:hypothetical protein